MLICCASSKHKYSVSLLSVSVPALSMCDLSACLVVSPIPQHQTSDAHTKGDTASQATQTQINSNRQNL